MSERLKGGWDLEHEYEYVPSGSPKFKMGDLVKTDKNLFYKIKEVVLPIIGSGHPYRYLSMDNVELEQMRLTLADTPAIVGDIVRLNDSSRLLAKVKEVFTTMGALRFILQNDNRGEFVVFSTDFLRINTFRAGDKVVPDFAPNAPFTIKDIRITGNGTLISYIDESNVWHLEKNLKLYDGTKLVEANHKFKIGQFVKVGASVYQINQIILNKKPSGGIHHYKADGYTFYEYELSDYKLPIIVGDYLTSNCNGFAGVARVQKVFAKDGLLRFIIAKMIGLSQEIELRLDEVTKVNKFSIGDEVVTDSKRKYVIHDLTLSADRILYAVKDENGKWNGKWHNDTFLSKVPDIVEGITNSVKKELEKPRKLSLAGNSIGSGGILANAKDPKEILIEAGFKPPLDYVKKQADEATANIIKTCDEARKEEVYKAAAALMEPPKPEYKFAVGTKVRTSTSQIGEIHSVYLGWKGHRCYTVVGIDPDGPVMFLEENLKLYDSSETKEQPVATPVTKIGRASQRLDKWERTLKVKKPEPEPLTFWQERWYNCVDFLDFLSVCFQTSVILGLVLFVLISFTAGALLTVVYWYPSNVNVRVVEEIAKEFPETHGLVREALMDGEISKWEENEIVSKADELRYEKIRKILD